MVSESELLRMLDVVYRRTDEIASLVASGATNRSIGEQLDCSPKTVEKHLATIFRKVGVASRVQLTAWVLDRAKDVVPRDLPSVRH